MTTYAEELKTAHLQLGDRPIQKILLPTDFTEKSFRPLGIAAELAAAAGAELHLLHIHQPMLSADEDASFPSIEDVRATTWASSPDSLRSLSKDRLAKLRVHEETREATDVPLEILRYVDEKAIDLLVVGTAARKGLARAFLGSVAEVLAQFAPCPVLVQSADSPVAIAAPTPTILAPIDFSSPSLRSLATAASLCEQLQGQLVLLHAIVPTPMPMAYGNVATMVSEHDDLRPRAEEHLQELAQTVPATVPTRCLVRRGTAAASILEAIVEVNADLVVIGSRGLTGLPRRLFGSVTQKVLRTSPIPVFVGRYFQSHEEPLALDRDCG